MGDVLNRRKFSQTAKVSSMNSVQIRKIPLLLNVCTEKEPTQKVRFNTQPYLSMLF